MVFNKEKTEFTLIQKRFGTSKKGNEYVMVTLRSCTEDGSFLKEFFVSPQKVGAMLREIPLDSLVYVDMILSEKLQPEIVSISRVGDEEVEL